MNPRSDYLPFGRPDFGNEEVEAVTRVIRSGWIGMGPEVNAFEQELSEACGAAHVVTVNSCTSALFLALHTQGVGEGDEVICPSLTWCSTANAALYLGATPVFCDVDESTLGLDPQSVVAALTPRTKAVVVVHFGGLAVDVSAMREVLPPSVAIIEDAAHAWGARYPDGRPVGSSGNDVCFSFYANKNLATGEGGAVALHDPSRADQLRSLRQHGLPLDAWKRYTAPKTLMADTQLTELGYKANFTDLQAAIGRVQLRRQQEFSARRLSIASAYVKALATFPTKPLLQAGICGGHHARHLFTVRFPFDKLGTSRESLLLALRARNIGATVHYTPLHTMPLYRNKARTTSRLAVTEEVARSILTLPISSSMTLDDAFAVGDHLREIVEGR